MLYFIGHPRAAPADRVRDWGWAILQVYGATPYEFKVTLGKPALHIWLCSERGYRGGSGCGDHSHYRGCFDSCALASAMHRSQCAATAVMAAAAAVAVVVVTS